VSDIYQIVKSCFENACFFNKVDEFSIDNNFKYHCPVYSVANRNNNDNIKNNNHVLNLYTNIIS
ncbi:MAG: hypothetical protein WA421_19720, partial [Nitrososphaeraceae archaeon]